MIIEKELDVNLYMPISKCDENMERAHHRDAAYKQKFWFRNTVQGAGVDKFSELSIEEILLGKEEAGFPGFKQLIKKYFVIQRNQVTRNAENRLYKSLKEIDAAEKVYWDSFNFVLKKS